MPVDQNEEIVSNHPFDTKTPSTLDQILNLSGYFWFDLYRIPCRIFGQISLSHRIAKYAGP